MHLSTLPPLRVLVASALIIGCASGSSVLAQDSASTQQARVQKTVNDLAARLGIADAVYVTIVPTNARLMSVEPAEHEFALKVEDGWAEILDDTELTAAAAHELGHVWVFTHHPFLQTEQLANEVAMRLVSPSALAKLYDKVWKRTNVQGDLARFLGPEVARGLASPEPAPQSPPTEFEVVSIKRSPADANGGGLQTLPDGTFVMRNQPLRSILGAGSPVPPSEIDGVPGWVAHDRYDITAKPPAGSTRPQRTAMMRRMLEDRFKLKGHVEQRERPTFALVLARSDGRLGPQLTPSALDCNRPNAGCGGSFGAGSIASEALRIDDVVPFFSNEAGRTVINRTGLKGFYALTLRWSAQRPPTPDSPTDDNPEFFTAIQEQLGLKLQPDRTMLPVFVVDSIERPSEN